MDYEKKYKEAFALMKDCIPDENGLVHVRPDDIFPELKESEDERIRKEMISWLKGFIGEEEGCGYTEDEIRERIAWLEKQGEQKPYGQREGCLDCQMNYAGECKGSCAMKRDEQKPAEIEKGRKGNEREIPNSAWSEEDEENLNWFEKFFRAESVVAEGKDIPQDRYLWFKNLKDRVLPQQKQEWSEEDEKMYARIVRSYTSYEGRILYATGLSEDNRNNILEDLNEQELWLKYRLKSLRPQNTWKPSEEQMDALEDAIADVVSSIQKNVLNSLYSDLQKLR